MGEQAEDLDVEDEVGRRAVHPELRVALRGNGIVGRIHLDNGELAGIVGQPIGGRLRGGRIESAGVD
jgi:hypothetical protein